MTEPTLDYNLNQGSVVDATFHRLSVQKSSSHVVSSGWYIEADAKPGPNDFSGYRLHASSDDGDSRLYVMARGCSVVALNSRRGVVNVRVADRSPIAADAVVMKLYERYPERKRLDEIAKTDPRAKQVKAEQLIDRRFLEEMEKDGTFERLGLR